MTFEEKVKSMTFAQILRAMVDGLKAEHVRVQMDAFGIDINGVCFGCAATNAICQISRHVFTLLEIELLQNRAEALLCDYYFLDMFEEALDCLRKNDFSKIGYDYYSFFCGIEQPIEEEVRIMQPLPPMTNKNWRRVLPLWDAACTEIENLKKITS